MPDPVNSIYQKVRSSMTPKYEPPLGERLTCPEAERGAVATQKIFWARICSEKVRGVVSG